jgi:5-formyltetrahydrofolate cyclo-ligase
MKRDFASPVAAAKEEARRAIRQRLRELDPAFRAEAALVICELAARLPAFRTGTCLALFAPLPSEPAIHPLIEEAWAQGKQVVLPRLLGSGTANARLEWRAVASWDNVIELGPFGLREPDPARCLLVDPATLSCVFVPGLAFDGTGLRLGRGGGFYDRFLSQAPASLARIGLMFSCQRVEKLPPEPHDQTLPAVITEDGEISFPTGA